MLDRARLGKQRIEVVQLLKALNGARAYANHPAAIMWRGKQVALATYGIAVCDEWVRRGYRDTQTELICDFFPFTQPEDLRMSPKLLLSLGELPWWFGWRRFHESHRSNLLRKDSNHYEFRFVHDYPEEGPRLPYVWPSDQPRKFKRQHSKDSVYYTKL